MKRIIIVGKAGSGKDYLKSRLIKNGYAPEISYTTRPPRDGEQDGISYYFVSDLHFQDMLDRDLFYEHANFNGWHYGTSKSQWDRSQLFIMTPSGIAQILPEDRKDCLVIFLDIPKEVRMERLLLRSDADKVERRLAADELDFIGFQDYDIKITNPDF